MPETTLAMVNCERDRRIAQGMFISLKSGHFVSVATGSEEDLRNINYTATTALSMIARTIPALALSDMTDPNAAPGAPTLHFRDYYRNAVELSYDEATEVGIRVTDALHMYNEAAHDLRDMTPIPEDYTNDSYWPQVPLPGPPPAGE